MTKRLPRKIEQNEPRREKEEQANKQDTQH